MSCLFDSLSYYVDNLNSFELRQKICDYLEKNPLAIDNIRLNTITELTYNKSLENYIKNMRLSSTWGSGIEIKCFCDMFGVFINIYHKNKIIEFIPKKIKINKVIMLSYTGNHYEHM